MLWKLCQKHVQLLILPAVSLGLQFYCRKDRLLTLSTSQPPAPIPSWRNCFIQLTAKRIKSLSHTQTLNDSAWILEPSSLLQQRFHAREGKLKPGFGSFLSLSIQGRVSLLEKQIPIPTSHVMAQGFCKKERQAFRIKSSASRPLEGEYRTPCLREVGRSDRAKQKNTRSLEDYRRRYSQEEPSQGHREETKQSKTKKT